jgi:hypothetical protein
MNMIQPRFGLKALLILMALVAAGMGGYMIGYERGNQDAAEGYRATQAALERQIANERMKQFPERSK